MEASFDDGPQRVAKLRDPAGFTQFAQIDRLRCYDDRLRAAILSSRKRTKGGGTMRMLDESAAWSASGRFMATCAMAEIGVALLVVMNPGFHGPRIFIGAAAFFLPSVLMIARCTMPAQMKGVLIMLICAALLGLSAALDPFGLRAVDAVIRNADHHDFDPAEAAQAAAAASVPSSTAVRIKATGDSDAAAVAQDIAEEVRRKGDFRANTAHVDGLVSVAKSADGPSYRLTWQIEKSGISLWCGRMATMGQKREEAVQSLSSAMLAAVVTLPRGRFELRGLKTGSNQRKMRNRSRLTL